MCHYSLAFFAVAATTFIGLGGEVALKLHLAVAWEFLDFGSNWGGGGGGRGGGKVRYQAWDNIVREVLYIFVFIWGVNCLFFLLDLDKAQFIVLLFKFYDFFTQI